MLASLVERFVPSSGPQWPHNRFITSCADMDCSTVTHATDQRHYFIDCVRSGRGECVLKSPDLVKQVFG